MAHFFDLSSVEVRRILHRRFFISPKKKKHTTDLVRSTRNSVLLVSHPTVVLSTLGTGRGVARAVYLLVSQSVSA